VTDCQTQRGRAGPGGWRAPGVATAGRDGPEGCFDEQTVLDLLAGELPEERLARAERHLGRCEACTDLLGATAPLLVARLTPGPDECG
jgi:hypothetical protein